MAKIPVQSSVVRKEYSNSVGEGAKQINLNFTLRQDMPDEMVGFIFLLKQALVTVEADLKTLQAVRKSNKK